MILEIDLTTYCGSIPRWVRFLIVGWGNAVIGMRTRPIRKQGAWATDENTNWMCQVVGHVPEDLTDRFQGVLQELPAGRPIALLAA